MLCVLPSLLVDGHDLDIFTADELDKTDCMQLCDAFLAGTIGHVAHGKSTLVKAISGVQVLL